MWDNVKPITLILEQKNEDETRFLLYFYSTDYELIKLREGTHFDASGNILGGYSRLLSSHDSCKYDSNFFVERLSTTTTQKLIEYYENPNLYIEYLM
tara:strand:+ start:86935 stop:87225 length:291 start_codon:yes stop_codon:yes gene_type:complete